MIRKQIDNSLLNVNLNCQIYSFFQLFSDQNAYFLPDACQNIHPCLERLIARECDPLVAVETVIDVTSVAEAVTHGGDSPHCAAPGRLARHLHCHVLEADLLAVHVLHVVVEGGVVGHLAVVT